jgi:hypothetical protein
MDARSHDRSRQAHDGLVTGACLAALACAAIALVAAVAGGLLRACPAPAPSTLPSWLVAGAASHAALMVCGVLGTVIGLERAVAVGRWGAFAAPLASACAALMTLAGHAEAAGGMFVLAAAAFVAVNVAILRRQPAAHTAMLLAGALAWLAGSLVHALGGGTAVPMWLSFLVLTIAAERLEMTRLTRRARHAGVQLWAVTALMIAGAGAAASRPAAGAAALGAFGASLVLLSAWLFAHDIARRTLWTAGLSRYMAVCLLAGYAWLGVSGVAWLGLAWGLPVRDMALHALGLGFVGSMMMAHAPVILPALTRVRLRFGAVFYMPLAVLHGSLVLRLAHGADDLVQRGVGAALNALAIALFAATVLVSAVAWRLTRHRPVPLEGS